jgi:hypothetical protein
LEEREHGSAKGTNTKVGGEKNENQRGLAENVTSPTNPKSDLENNPPTQLLRPYNYTHVHLGDTLFRHTSM